MEEKEENEEIGGERSLKVWEKEKKEKKKEKRRRGGSVIGKRKNWGKILISIGGCGGNFFPTSLAKDF